MSLSVLEIKALPVYVREKFMAEHKSGYKVMLALGQWMSETENPDRLEAIKREVLAEMASQYPEASEMERGAAASAINEFIKTLRQAEKQGRVTHV